MLCFFFFKQKTAYDMRISDWSSDVCSSDLAWKVSAEEIKARGYNLDISNPRRREEDHQDPAELLAAWQENRKHLVATQEQLKAVDRKSVVKGKSGSVSVDLGGRGCIKKKNINRKKQHKQ